MLTPNFGVSTQNTYFAVLSAHVLPIFFIQPLCKIYELSLCKIYERVSRGTVKIDFSPFAPRTLPFGLEHTQG